LLTPYGRIEARLQRVRTDHSSHCFGKTPMQTSRGVAHVAQENSIRDMKAIGETGK
jgi:hypothetical protein